MKVNRIAIFFIDAIPGIAYLLIIMIILSFFIGYNKYQTSNSILYSHNRYNILQKFAYRIYDMLNGEIEIYNQLPDHPNDIVTYRASNAVEKIQNGLGYKYQIISNGYIIIIQYDFFEKNKINWPIYLLRNRYCNITYDDVSYGFRFKYSYNKEYNVTLNDYLTKLGYIVVIFRDTDWLDHLIVGPLIVPLNNYE